MKKFALASLVVAAMAAAPSQSQAQILIGPLAAFHGDFDFGVGGFIKSALPSVHENLSILADIEIWFPGNDISVQTFAGGVAYDFPLEDAPVMPFAFGQLALARVSVDVDTPFGSFGGSGTEFGLHLGGGVAFGATDSGLRPAAGVRIELGAGEGFAVFGALGFPVG